MRLPGGAVSSMVKGTRVSFTWEIAPGVEQAGTGIVISDEEDGRVQVAIDPTPPEARHFVIWCTVTWLTVLPPPAGA